MSNSYTDLDTPQLPGVSLNFDTLRKKAEFKTGIPVFVGFGKLIDSDLHQKNQLPWRRITAWQQFDKYIDIRHNSITAQSFLRHAVRGFFENGGECCVVLPITASSYTAEALGEPFLEASKNHDPAKNKRGWVEDIEDIDLVCVPDLMMAEFSHLKTTVIKVQQQILDHCKKMGDRFAILDTFPLHVASDIDAVKNHRFQIPSAMGAIYFPWLSVYRLNPQLSRDLNPTAMDFFHASSKTKDQYFVPPCGHIAGVYARTDAKAGVFKAPANEVVEGVFDLQWPQPLSQAEQANLTAVGVNYFKASLSRGIRVWGARTLSNHEYDRYIPTRRLFLTLSRWIDKNMRDLIFEANQPSMWLRIKHRLESYCYELFQKGALHGVSPEEAYFVKCDRELNADVTREAGQVICEVGLAATAPAEFIVVRITQSVSGSTIADLTYH
ncbi:MAG: phage tail sheath family protein [Methylococcaceae bacterium]|nr:phage tail sheath family protein [Methylococcaceae bacterium]